MKNSKDFLTNIVEVPKTKSEAESLIIYNLENFKLLFGWSYGISCCMQSIQSVNFFKLKNMDIDKVIKLLQELILFLENYREFGFASAVDETKQMAI